MNKRSLLTMGFPWLSGKLSVLLAVPLFLGPPSVSTRAPVAGQFTYTGNLNAARYEHTATSLPNGKVLVSGGADFTGTGHPLASAELYDPASGAWTVTGSLNTARVIHTATSLFTGKVLVAGGYGNDILTSAELYDPSIGGWTVTGSLNTARYVHTATLLPNGKVLVAGGYNDDSGVLTSAELYDPASGSWSATGDLNTARREHTAISLANGKVLVAGGSNSSGYLTNAELYDPASGAWTVTGSLNMARTSFTATLLSNGNVLVAGGFDSSGNSIASAELYDPASGSWNTTGSLNTARDVHTATLLPNGKVLVTGGFNAGSVASAELYDPASGSWNTTGSLNAARQSHTATLLSTGNVLVAGGYSFDGVHVGGPLTSAELYEPADSAVTPFIISQPQGTVVIAGNTASFSVTASSATQLSYQWYLGSSILSGANGQSLMISNAQQIANAGNYTVVVSNPYGSVMSAPAKLTVIPTPTATVATPPYPAPITTEAGKDSLIFITHGLTPNSGDEDWIYDMGASLAGKVPSNWTITPYAWTDLSSILFTTVPREPDFVHGASRAAAVGNKVGWEIINSGISNTPNKKWQHIHFIAHSAGAALVEEAAAIVKLYSLNHGWNTDIQITFLDPYTGFYDEWRSVYGIDAAWADDYFCIDTNTFDPTLGPFGRTDGALTNSYSVDVTARDPSVTLMPFWCAGGGVSTPCRYQPYSTHSWPITWYQNTITQSPDSRDSGYGFPLSSEAGGAGGSNFNSYPPNTTPVVLGGSQTIIQGPINLGPGLIVNYSNTPNAISQTGTVQTTNSGFNGTGGAIQSQASRRAAKGRIRSTSTAATGDPVWISVPVDTQTDINYVACDLTFTSEAGAAGLVTVYWNGEQIGFIDEQYAIPGTKTYSFGVSGSFLDKNNALAFRLDEFSNVTSSISVANVRTGFGGLTQTPVLSITASQSGNKVMNLTGMQGYTFLIQASTDLSTWTPISNVSLSDGATAQFTDLAATNFQVRFYRAVSP